MNIETVANKSGSFIVSQLGNIKKSSVAPSLPFAPNITIAPQTGSGAHEIAQRVARILERNDPNGPGQWRVHDRQLVEKVLEEYHLPERMAKLVPEDRRSCIQDITEELLGLRPRHGCWCRWSSKPSSIS